MKYRETATDVYSILKMNYNQFTTVEKDIADFFLNNKEQHDFSSKNIAELLFTSEASISRFAKKCGFKGYREFIYWYQKQFEQEQYGRLGDGNSLILNTYQELLNKTYSMINEEQIRRIAQHISQKKQIFIYGKGFSGVTAHELQLRLICIGINAQYITDTYIMAMNSTLINADSMIIGVSISGETKEIFYSLEKAKVQEAYTVAISSIHLKEWDNFCDEVLLVPTKENLTLGKLISPQLPVLILFDMIYSNILQQGRRVKADFPEFIRAELNERLPPAL